MATPILNQLPLAPLGAGDLIDRALRLYRRHLLTLMRIAAPPVIITAIGGVLFTVGWRNIFSTPDTNSLVLYLFLLLGGLAVTVGGHIFNLIVMGGAARNLVTHLLWNEPVSVHATYAAVWSRFWKLLIATLLIVLWGSMAVLASFVAWYTVVIFLAIFAMVSVQIAPAWVSAVVGIVGFLIALAVAVWLFFLMIGRVAYVPQVMLVEGKGVLESITRSFSLAKGNVRRLMAMTLFIIFATYSALMILLVPLGWYAYLNGIDPSPWNAAAWPTWYAIGNSVLGPISSLLLTPVWMLGLVLLYVDERVRHEGYDLELMASQRLGEMPELSVSSPFGKAISIDNTKTLSH